MSTNNITYILGAGASCKALPLVSDMKQRMQILLDILNPNNILNSGFNAIHGVGYNTQLLFNNYNQIVQEANKHYTPDTFAKKLWLTDKTEELKLFKEFLNLYFIFEQESNLLPFGEALENDELVRRLPEGSITDIPNLKLKKSKKEKLWDKISVPIDYRYDVFFATLLKENNGVLEIPQNINIISWNYDNQFELAYKEYCSKSNFKEILDILKIYPCPESSDESNIGRIIRLNGSANKYLMRRNKYNLGDEINALSSEYQDDSDKEVDFYELLDMLIAGNVNDYSNNINFAWEREKLQSKAPNTSSNFLFYSDIIVIIGYSFPNFNREVDEILFARVKNKSMRDSSIYIQVPEKEEYLKIKERIQTIIKLDESCFKHISDADQFYIPL